MNSLLKFITCGSVDDGKSTLIGHMLYDAKLLFADQKRALELDSKVGSRGGAIDYSLLYEVMGDKGTDKSLSKEEVKELFLKANKLYIDWVFGYATTEIKDSDDRIYPEGYVRIHPTEFSSLDELKSMLDEYFISSIYMSTFERDYKTIDGKIYVIDAFGEGASWEPAKYKLTIISSNNSFCEFQIEEYLTDDQKTDGVTDDFIRKNQYEVCKKDGHWVFVGEFAQRRGLYNNSPDIQWLD